MNPVKLISGVVTVWKLVAKYPAISAGLAQVAVLIGAQFGLHLTTGQLASFAGAIAGIFALLVHAGVIPVTKVDNVKAGLKPTVPADVAVADAKPVTEATPTPTVPVPVQVVPGALTTIEANRTKVEDK